MTLAIVFLVLPVALWAADRVFNRGELFLLLREELNLERPYEAATLIRKHVSQIVRTHPHGVHSDIAEYLRLLASYAKGTSLGKELSLLAGPTGSTSLGMPALVDRSG